MKAGFIALIVLGGITLTAGGIFLGVAIAQNNKVIKKDIEVTESFSNFDVTLQTSDITFKKSEDDKCKIESYEKERYHHVIKVEDNTLKITYVDNLRFYEKIFGYNGPKLNVYLPSDTYEAFSVKCKTGDVVVDSGFTFSSVVVDCTTGNVKLKEVTTGDVGIKSTTGAISLENFTCNNLVMGTTTGDVNLKSVNCASANIIVTTGKVYLEEFADAGILNIQTSTGDVIFKNIDAVGEIKITTTTGKVRGNFLTAKHFIAKTKTGKINVPDTEGTRCEITTTTGDINIEVKHA